MKPLKDMIDGCKVCIPRTDPSLLVQNGNWYEEVEFRPAKCGETICSGDCIIKLEFNSTEPHWILRLLSKPTPEQLKKLDLELAADAPAKVTPGTLYWSTDTAAALTCGAGSIVEGKRRWHLRELPSASACTAARRRWCSECGSQYTYGDKWPCSECCGIEEPHQHPYWHPKGTPPPAQPSHDKSLALAFTEIPLCNVEKILLRPGQLYRFVVMPGCASCAKLAADYAPGKPGHDPDTWTKRFPSSTLLKVLNIS